MTRSRHAAAAGRAVQALLDQAVAEGREDTVQVAAYLDGTLVVDAWAARPGLGADGRALIPFFSTGKGIAATAVHRLVERGVLAWDAPVARYWPEFAARGKGGILLRHVLNHTAGLPMLPAAGNRALAADWDAVCRFLADSEPLHAPGAQRHYHAVTFAWLVGETARRADGRPFGRIVREEVLEPLGVADELFFGVPEEAWPRVVDAVATPPPPPDPARPPGPPDPVAARAIPIWIQPLEDWVNDPGVRRACIPASNGFGTARAVARHYAALVGTGADGVRLLAPGTVEAATRWDPIADGRVPGDGRRGLGYGLQGPDDDPGAVFGHGGYGGSTGFADRRCGLAVGIVKSRMNSGPLATQAIDLLRRGLGLTGT